MDTSNRRDGNNDIEEDNLITYREFISAIRRLVPIKILPRTLSFREVLGT